MYSVYSIGYRRFCRIGCWYLYAPGHLMFQDGSSSFGHYLHIPTCKKREKGEVEESKGNANWFLNDDSQELPHDTSAHTPLTRI